MQIGVRSWECGPLKNLGGGYGVDPRYDRNLDLTNISSICGVFWPCHDFDLPRVFPPDAWYGHCVQNLHGSNNKNAASGWGPQHTPWKIHILHPKMEVWEMIFLFNQVIFRFHANSPECTREGKARKTNTCS